MADGDVTVSDETKLAGVSRSTTGEHQERRGGLALLCGEHRVRPTQGGHPGEASLQVLGGMVVACHVPEVIQMSEHALRLVTTHEASGMHSDELRCLRALRVL